MRLVALILIAVIYSCSGDKKPLPVDSSKQESKMDSLYIGVRNADLLSGAEREYLDSIKGQNGAIVEMSYMKIKGDSVFLDKENVLLVDGKSVSLKNDGIGYYYKGVVQKTGNKLHFKVEELIVNFHIPMKVNKDGSLKLTNGPYEFEGEVFDNRLGDIVDNKLIVKGERFTVGGKFVPYYIEFAKRRLNKKLVSETSRLTR